MPQRLRAVAKKVFFALCILTTLIACEKDLNDIAVGIIDKGDFVTGDELVDIIAYNINIDSSRVDNNNPAKQPMALMGVNQNQTFGHLQSGSISQMHLPLGGVNFGDNTVIDLVVLDLPYYVTKEAENQKAVDPITGEELEDEDGNPIMVPSFKLDSVYGNKDVAFNVSVKEMGTFLNVLDPNNPTEAQQYFSDKVYQLKDEIFSDNFKTNRNDTVLYVERRYLDNDPNTVDDVDTVKATNSQPTMKFELDKQFFKTRFVDHNNPNDFLSNEHFIHYFRGLLIDAQGADGALINYRINDATLTIYYTDDQIETEGDDEDLNGNGVNGEEDVVVRTKQSMTFTLGGVKSAIYTRDYAGSVVQPYLDNPDKINGQDKLFVQGAAGSEVVIDIFNDSNLDELRDKNYLINEANLVMRIDGDQKEVPQRLYLYNKGNGSTLNDFVFESPEVYGGFLEYDDDGNPKQYKFRITRYVSSILRQDNPVDPYPLGLKNYLTTDLPLDPVIDTLVQPYNFIPKGVVLKGNIPNSDEKSLKLEIFYSKLNETNN